MQMTQAKAFYEKQYEDQLYAPAARADLDARAADLRAFIERYQLPDKRCLEVGCGRGAFQDLIADYTGLDLAESVRCYLHKPFVAGSATALPFADRAFDVIWSVAVLEHVPDPQRALEEMRRVLTDGGLLYLAPAWLCRPWRAEGYPVRPYSDLNWKGKLIKASIPIRDTLWCRAAYVLPRRARRIVTSVIRRRPATFSYRKLKPNYTRFWMSDSDAVNSMDPYEAIVWFTSRGDECLSYPSRSAQLLVRDGALVFRIHKR